MHLLSLYSQHIIIRKNVDKVRMRANKIDLGLIVNSNNMRG